MVGQFYFIRRLLYSFAAVFCAGLFTVSSATAAAEKVILVGNFANETGDPKWNGVGVGIANSISVKLSRISSIKVTSEEARRQAMAEQRFGMSGIIDAATAAEAGKIAGATHVAYGTYTIAGDELMAFAYLVNCTTAITEGSCESYAKTDSTASLINEISLALASSAGAQATEAEIALVKSGNTGTSVNTMALEGKIADLIFDETGLFIIGLSHDILEESAAMCRQILEIEPLNPYAHSYLAMILRELGGSENFKSAEWHYRKVIEIDPGHQADYSNLGELLTEMGNFEGAFEALNTALKLDPNYESAHMNLGNLKLKTGDYDGAIESYSTSLKLRPNHPLTMVNLGTAYKKKGDIVAAISEYESAIHNKPDYYLAHYQLANTLCDIGEYEAALASALRADELMANDYETHYLLGRVYHGLEDYTAGAKAFKFALEINPDYANAWTALGLCHFKKGDFQAARAAFRKGMELAKPGQWAYDKSAEYLLQMDNASE